MHGKLMKIAYIRSSSKWKSILILFGFDGTDACESFLGPKLLDMGPEQNAVQKKSFFREASFSCSMLE